MTNDMPLKAIVDSVSVIAPTLDDDEWTALHVAVRNGRQAAVLPCCNRKAGLGTSRLGTRHFYHLSNRSDTRADCDWNPEEPEQLAIKGAIAHTCRELGHKAETEVHGTPTR